MFRILTLASFLVMASAGCVVHTDGDRRGVGTLIVDWTVEGSKARAACYETGADAISVSISTDGGRLVDELTERCDAFEIGVDLRSGTYVVDVVLLDAEGYEITTTVSDRQYVYPAEAIVSAFDFPGDSFL